MLKRNTELIKDEETRQAIDFIQEEALGKAVDMNDTPASTTPVLSDGEWGVYGNKVYFRVGMKIYRFDPDATVTVT